MQDSSAKEWWAYSNPRKTFLINTERLAGAGAIVEHFGGSENAPEYSCKHDYRGGGLLLTTQLPLKSPVLKV
jgi:hypothetical protein